MPDITCSATCYFKTCSFSWTKSGTEVSNSGVLSLGSVHKNEAGYYMCTAMNQGSLVNVSSGIIVVEIVYGPDNITLSTVIKTYTLNEGQTLNDITCSAKCFPECTYSWKRGNTVITNNYELSVGSVKKGDAGIYECAVRNPKTGHMLNSQTVELIVRYGPDTAILSPSTLYYSTTEGSIISTITCSATCYPSSCSFSWSKSGTEVSSSNVLSLGYAQTNDTGNYVCIAKNPGSLTNASSAIMVVEILYGPTNINLSPVNRSYTLNEGQTLHNITCSAKCVPECIFSWKRSNNVMNQP
ncbi:hypothetical protein DPMN_130757 [Dreissena polymorpha]|uniref:Ig-like domain-containing protein n=1 Tax=Dreissena polymorpha TaxID=45954 RepID=A0A9D4H3F3_DREPO|nr:hypothetical protein DPMN_130757 [Dreissena polymorpha]